MVVWDGPCLLDLIESPEVQKITGQIGSPLSRIRTILRLMRSTKGIQQQLIRDQKRAVEVFQPHRIVFHIKCIYPAMLGATRQCDVELLSPIPCMIHPIAEEPHIGFGTPRGAWWNRLTYRLANRVMIRKNILDYGGDLAREWGMPLDHQTLSSFFSPNSRLKSPQNRSFSRDLRNGRSRSHDRISRT